MNKSSQLPFNLPLDPAHGLEDLVISTTNRDAVAFIKSWPQWPGPIAILAGPVGVGKSHMAAIWAQMSGALFLAGDDDLAGRTIDVDNVVVEDVEAGNFSELALFHLINNLRANQGSILLTSRVWPGNWELELPDLKSRLKLAHLVEMGEPDDDLLRGVLTKLFSDRQIDVERSVVDYLVLRMERSLASAQILVSALDELSMVQKRAITKPLAAEALRQMQIQI